MDLLIAEDAASARRKTTAVTRNPKNYLGELITRREPLRFDARPRTFDRVSASVPRRRM